MRALLARRVREDGSGEATVPPGRDATPFGGALMAHLLLQAADSSAARENVHSLHVHFLTRGRAPANVTFNDITLKASRRFSAVRVDGWQEGALLCSGVAAFHVREDSPHHAPKPPDGVDGDPEGRPPATGGVTPSPESPIRAPFDLRAANAVAPGADGRPRLGFWVRLRDGSLGPTGDAAALAWATDFVLTRVADVEYENDAQLPHRRAASLEQVLWFHRPVDLGEWVYYEVTSPWYEGARALSTGTVHDRSGKLLATVAQESLLRRTGGPL